MSNNKTRSRHIRNRICLLFVSVILTLLGATIFGQGIIPAMADESSGDSQSLSPQFTIQQTFTVDKISEEELVDQTIEYEISAVNSAPMPQNAADGKYRFSLTGGTTDAPVTFTMPLQLTYDTAVAEANDTITIRKPGTYTYQVQKTTKKSGSRYQLSDKVYQINLYVTNKAGDTSGTAPSLQLEAITVYEAGKTVKTSPVFAHSYKGYTSLRVINDWLGDAASISSEVSYMKFEIQRTIGAEKTADWTMYGIYQAIIRGEDVQDPELTFPRLECEDAQGNSYRYRAVLHSMMLKSGTEILFEDKAANDQEGFDGTIGGFTTSSKSFGNQADGFETDITNASRTGSILVVKQWDDDDNHAQARPDAITFLLKNGSSGVKIAEKTLSGQKSAPKGEENAAIFESSGIPVGRKCHFSL